MTSAPVLRMNSLWEFKYRKQILGESAVATSVCPLDGAVPLACEAGGPSHARQGLCGRRRGPWADGAGALTSPSPWFPRRAPPHTGGLSAARQGPDHSPDGAAGATAISPKQGQRGNARSTACPLPPQGQDSGGTAALWLLRNPIPAGFHGGLRLFSAAEGLISAPESLSDDSPSCETEASEDSSAQTGALWGMGGAWDVEEGSRVPLGESSGPGCSPRRHPR